MAARCNVVGKPPTPGKPPVKACRPGSAHRHAQTKRRLSRRIANRLRKKRISLGRERCWVRRKPTWSGVSCNVPKGSPTLGCVKRHQSEVVCADVGESCLMPPRNFVGKIVIGFVFLDRPAESRARLHPRVSRIGNRAERIHRLKIPVAQVAEHVAVKFIRSRACDDVHHSAGGTAILRRHSCW